MKINKIVMMCLLSIVTSSLLGNIELYFFAKDAQEVFYWKKNVFDRLAANDYVIEHFTEPKLKTTPIGNRFSYKLKLSTPVPIHIEYDKNKPFDVNKPVAVVMDVALKMKHKNIKIKTLKTQFPVVDGATYVLSVGKCKNNIAVADYYDWDNSEPEICVSKFNNAHEAQEFVESSLAIKKQSSATAEHVGSAAAPNCAVNKSDKM